MQRRSRKQQTRPNAPESRVMFIFDVFVDFSFCFRNRVESVRVDPRFHWPLDLSISKSGLGHSRVPSLPSNRNWTHPQCKMANRSVTQRIKLMNLHDHQRRCQLLQNPRLKVKRRYRRNRRQNSKSIVKYMNHPVVLSHDSHPNTRLRFACGYSPPRNTQHNRYWTHASRLQHFMDFDATIM